MPKYVIFFIGVITFGIAVYYNWLEVQRASVCDTTYIYEGYSNVELPSEIINAFPRYKLVRYADNAPQLQHDIAILRRKHSIPLLFVHGHLGSPQQMRSMASETSRELVRRLKASSGNKQNWDMWIDWHAVNFNEEPSAFEPALLEEQARFVAAIVRHLGSKGTGTSSTTTSPLILIGYSMGGLVVESALKHLSHTPELFDTRRIALVLTLGAPRHHLPTFLPRPRHRPSGQNMNHTTPGLKLNLAEGAKPLEIQSLGNLYHPASVHILAGPGDLMIPGLSSWGTLNERQRQQQRLWRWWRQKNFGGKLDLDQGRLVVDPGMDGAMHDMPAVPAVQVDMDDVPGVWCTSSHKSMVSCNQLVRQVVPLLVDAAHAARKGVPREDIRALAGWRLTTCVLQGMLESVQHAEESLKPLLAAGAGLSGGSFATGTPGTVLGAPSEQEICKDVTRETIANEGGVFTRRLDDAFLIRNAPVSAYSQRCWSWDVTSLQQNRGSLFLLLTGLIPSEGFLILGIAPGKGAPLDLTLLARPLPGMLKEYPTAAAANSKRLWYEVLAGINWMSNATRVLHLPIGKDKTYFTRIELHTKLPLTQSNAPSDAPPTFIAQLVQGGDGDQLDPLLGGLQRVVLNNKLRKQLTHPFSTASHVIFRNHPLAIQLEISPREDSMYRHYYRDTTAQGIPALAAALLFGQELPFRLTAVPMDHHHKKKAGNSEEESEKIEESEWKNDVPEHRALLLAVDSPRSSSQKQTEDVGRSAVIGDAVRFAEEGLSLWHPAVSHRHVLLISDPRYRYEVRVTWDLSAWISYTLRYHAYSLSPVTFALSLLRLGHTKHPSLYLLSVLVLIPMLSTWPELADAVVGPPWLPLSAVEVFLIGSVAAVMLSSLAWSVLAWRKSVRRSGTAVLYLLSYFRGRKNGEAAGRKNRDLLLSGENYQRNDDDYDSANKKGDGRKFMQALALGIVLASTALHPAMPALLGLTLLASTTAIFLPFSSSSQAVSISLAVDWLCVHLLAAVPAAIWAFGWIVSGRSHGYRAVSAERVCVLVIGTHACVISFQLRSTNLFHSKRRMLYILKRPNEGLCSVLAVAVAVCGLWGNLFSVMMGATVLCSWEIAVQVSIVAVLWKKRNDRGVKKEL